jgi:DNA processing protein
VRGDRLARIALARVAEPGNIAVREAIEREGAEHVWAAVREGRPVGAVKNLAGLLARGEGYDPERDLAAMGSLGGRVVVPGDAEWPSGLDWPADTMTGTVAQMAAPWVLFLRGAAPLPTGLSVAVVGARAASAYGVHVAGELAFALAEAGAAVVSGGAYGIDAAAHRGALTAQAAPTVAVLASGVDVPYPRGNDQLLARIAENGLILSEVPPGSAPTRVRFLVRNRLIAALSKGTVVVEAAPRSGSLSTAGRTADLGRPVMAVPGPVTSVSSAGCHQLLRDTDAMLVTCAAEVLEGIGRPGEHLAPVVRGRADPRDGLDELVRRVLDAVPVRLPVSVARISRTAGVSALLVQQVLPELLLSGLVVQRDGGWHLSTLGAGR